MTSESRPSLAECVLLALAAPFGWVFWALYSWACVLEVRRLTAEQDEPPR